MATTDPLVNVTMSDVFATTPLGSTENAIVDNLYGINNQQIQPLVPSNKDHYGYAFFTRPQLNLSGDNLRNVRQLTRLLTEDEFSYHRAARVTLDPRLQWGFGMDDIAGSGSTDRRSARAANQASNEIVRCSLIDSKNIFIPLLTNNLVSLTGWKDMELPIHVSKEGAYKEAWTTPDGIVDDYTNYTLTANFRNIAGDPITTLFGAWVRYMSNVFTGGVYPYPDYMMRNMQDFNTRIYRIILDRNKEKVQGIMATGVAVPNVVSIGNKFDLNIDKPYNDINAEISIPFSCLGQMWNDEILIREFNTAVQIFNPSMYDSVRHNAMVRTEPGFRALFKNNCYPHINERNYNLEWWVDKEVYDYKMGAIKNIDKAFNFRNQFTAPIHKDDITKTRGFTTV